MIASLRVSAVGEGAHRRYRLRFGSRYYVVVGPRRSDKDMAEHDKKVVIDKAGDDISEDRVAVLVKDLMKKAGRKQNAKKETRDEKSKGKGNNAMEPMS